MKNPPFRKLKTFSFVENLSKCTCTILHKPKAFLLHKPSFSVLKRHPILQTKSFPFEQAFRCYSQKPSFF